MKIESSTLDRQREINRHRDDRGNHKPMYYSSWVVWEYVIFDSLHIIASCVQVTFFSSFLSRVLSKCFPFDSFPVNQSPSPICCWYISVLQLGVRCYHNLDLENHLIHLPIRSSPTIISLSLSLSPRVSNFSYMFRLCRCCLAVPKSYWERIHY